jgi:hypothetical protein
LRRSAISCAYPAALKADNATAAEPHKSHILPRSHSRFMSVWTSFDSIRGPGALVRCRTSLLARSQVTGEAHRGEHRAKVIRMPAVPSRSVSPHDFTDNNCNHAMDQDKPIRLRRPNSFLEKSAVGVGFSPDRPTIWRRHRALVSLEDLPKNEPGGGFVLNRSIPALLVLFYVRLGLAAVPSGAG